MRLFIFEQLPYESKDLFAEREEQNRLHNSYNDIELGRHFDLLFLNYPPFGFVRQVDKWDNLYMRKFKTGATRDDDTNKLDFEGAISSLALERFVQYMHKHRTQADGKLRTSDNWQKGIDKDAYMKSMWRHFFDVWSIHRGHKKEIDLEEALCALLFNVQGLLHETIKDNSLTKVEEATMLKKLMHRIHRPN